MLDYLHIENIAVAKNVEIEFNDGFNVLTGETGAGKSVIIDSINLILGSKASKELIRHGEEKATVTAFFSSLSDDLYGYCDDAGIDYDKDDSFVIKRTFNLDGKNIVKINSQPVTMAQLRQIGSMLINIHGQNENQTFINKANHILILDEYSNIKNLLDEYSEYYAKLNKKKAEIASLLEKNKQTEAMLDLLNYQIKEIESAKLNDIDEEEKLVQLRTKLKSAEKIIKNSSNVYKLLYKNESGISASVLIDKTIDSLSKISDIDSSIEDMILNLKSFRSEMIDIAERVADLANFDDIEDPDKQLDIIEDRLTVIQRMQKKYGSTIQEIIDFKNDARDKLKSFENGEIQLDVLKKDYKELHKEASNIAEEIHKIRVSSAKELSNLVKESLLFLDMPKVQFEIKVVKNERDGAAVLSSKGFDDVEFMIATNAGENLTQMTKIVSGGELARIMLAIKSTISHKNRAQTIIFDEIDTGVSGSTSQKIGIKLSAIAKSSQTICVTHSAQIASLSENHFLIVKNILDGRAQTQVKLLNEKEKIDEIARIIGGIDLTDKQYDAANDLINQSKALLSENQ